MQKADSLCVFREYILFFGFCGVTTVGFETYRLKQEVYK